MLLHYRHYVGVINPRWLVFIATLALIPVMLYTASKGSKTVKIAFNLALAGVLIFLMALFPVPTYTYAEGRAILEKEVSGTVGQPYEWNKVSGHYFTRTFPFKKFQEVYIASYDHWYAFEVVAKNDIAIYTVNPMTGKWVKEITLARD